MDDHRDSVVSVVIAPAAWAAYFLAVYVTGAIHCAKAGADAGIEPVRLFVVLSGIATLALIGAIGWAAFRRWRTTEDGGPPHHDDTPESRHRFLAFATLLLAGLSFVATLYTAMPALFVGSCR